MRTLVFLAALFVAGSGSASPRPLTLCGCTPGTCGGFAQNQATLKSGAARIVASFNPGELHIQFNDLRDLNDQPIAYKVFKVYYGQLTNHIAAVSYLGSITVAHGYSDGPIWNGNAPYLFPPGAVLTGHFYLNDDSVPNTQFVSCLYL